MLCTPSREEIESFGPLCRQFHRLVVMAHAKEDSSAFYLHLLAGHGGTYMTHLRSLGKYMNGGLEANHKMSNEIMTHTTNGGTPGTQSRMFKENGVVSYERGAFEQRRRDEKQQVLEWQSRDVWQDIKDFADQDWLRSEKTAEQVWPTTMGDAVVWPTALSTRIVALRKEFLKFWEADHKVAMMIDSSKKKMASAKSEPLAMEIFTKRKAETPATRKKARH
jgi:hypothetical protein